MKGMMLAAAAACVMLTGCKTGMSMLRSDSPDGASVTILSPKDGDTVEKTFTVKFGIEGMAVVPAGKKQDHSGHHHLLIDMKELPDMAMPLPATSNLVHFGGGQTETTLTLTPGTHTLQLLLGNHLHIPHDPPVLSEKITITAK